MEMEKCRKMEEGGREGGREERQQVASEAKALGYRRPLDHRP